MRVRHVGKIGDVVYATAAMKRLHTLTGYLVDVVLGDYYLPPAAMQAITPLLRSQNDYIGSVLEDHGQQCDVDFRNWLAIYNHHDNVVQSVLDFVADPQEANITIDTDNPARPWLDIEAPDNGLVLVNWTGRYLNRDDTTQRLDWRLLLDAYPGARFIGLPEEHAAFCRHF